MAQDLKISELAAKAFNVETSGTDVVVDNITQSGKYIVPAYIPGEGNKSLDIGLLFNIFKLYINQAAQQAVQNIIDQGGGSSGGSSGGGSSSQDTTALSNQINELRNAVYNPQNYPTTFIKLVNGSDSIIYQIVSGLGQSSAYGQNNPIVIHTTQVDPADFYVEILPGIPTKSGDSVLLPVTVSVYSQKGSDTYNGGTIGQIIITGTLTTSNGQYEARTTTNALASVNLNSSKTSDTVTDYLEFDAGDATPSLATVTCSVHGTALGSYGTYIYSNQTAGAGSGTITV